MELPSLVSSIQEKKFSSVDTLFKWLERIEETLKTLNYTQCAEVSGLRAQLAQQKFVINSKPNERKKRQISKALEIIHPAQAVVSQIVLPLEEKIEQARGLLKQILNVASSLGILPDATPQDFNSYVYNIWGILLAHDQLKNGMNNVKALIGMADGIQILAEEIDM
ncbi:hypothetical protein PW52_07975 [Tamlana sedimentorum]|uniref:Uncharacterized protein n=1 Tax=Neotamlana sedimentorum TaxID=1435349 RepID=A0A0D7W974_9FLAO|nr:hypothetical protein [Tamlana sedimentorum]KJD35671.1 hypothetical protein PW52_07975 [Tamlana sedimentorum]